MLLGILAATALPRFIDVTDEAHESVVQAVYGGLNTGISLARSEWVATGNPATVTLDGGTSLTMIAGSGYPSGTSEAECAAIYSGVLQSGAPSSTTAAEDLIAQDGIDNIDGVDGSGDRVDFQIFQTTETGTPSTGDDTYHCFFVYTGQYDTVTNATSAGLTGLPVIHYEYEVLDGDGAQPASVSLENTSNTTLFETT